MPKEKIKKKVRRGRWKVYVEGVACPVIERLTQKDARLIADQFGKNGVHASAQSY